MKSNVMANIARALILTCSFVIPDKGWATELRFRTFQLDLSPEQVWKIVTETVEAKFSITSEDSAGHRIEALGEPHWVQAGLLWRKKEREKISVRIEVVRLGVYACFIEIEVLEWWHAIPKWRPMEDVDTTETRISLGETLTENLRPHFKTAAIRRDR